jgi:hypothetical protein
MPLLKSMVMVDAVGVGAGAGAGEPTGCLVEVLSDPPQAVSASANASAEMLVYFAYCFPLVIFATLS